MHVLIWKSKDRLYATASRDVLEVIPVVWSEPLATSEPWVLGTFNYRGRLIALIDATQMLHGTSPIRRQFARILVVATQSTEGDHRPCIGLLVDSVQGSDQLDFENAQTLESVELSNESGFLGPVALFDSHQIQLTDPSRLVLPPAAVDP